MNLAAAPNRRIDKAVDSFAAGGFVFGFRVELKIETVAVLKPLAEGSNSITNEVEFSALSAIEAG